MPNTLTPGDQVLINGKEAEVIRTYTVGDLPFIRAYFSDEGVKTVCKEDVSIEKNQLASPQLKNLSIDKLHPQHEAVSAQRFDLRTEAIQLRLAHHQGQLLSISNSLVHLEPYQLACVNEVMSNLRQRYLIADDVGLGKTIEAGLILKELQARYRADRVLIIVPAHLQKKWIRDMERFFDVELTLADRVWVDSERRRLGEKTNIWAQDKLQLLTSIAFLRQDEFQKKLEETFWDLVIVDEAHKVSKRGDSPSKRAKMVERTAERSDAFLLLTATPHDGKEQSFRSLMEYIDPFIAAPKEKLERGTIKQLMIRRGKTTIYDDEGERIFPDRNVRTVPVRMSPEEKTFYNTVTEYVQKVYNRSKQLNEPAVGFAMALMQKRLVSSLEAIRETLRRRLRDLLEVDSSDLSSKAEGYLNGNDLDELEKERVEREIERLTFANTDEELEKELQTLQELVNKADSLPIDSKAQKVLQFIQQLFEENPHEKLILFTEYRDTLEYLTEEVFANEPWADEILIIHGGIPKNERERIEKEFNYRRSRLLLATDAASEGIDLQHSCHIMVNYELPWNPNRLEQRIGRIHRYGQDKEVKVWNFQFKNTRESKIFELLTDKIESIRSHIGTTADMIGMLEDLDIKSLIMNSLHDEKPPSATKEKLKKMIAERQQTLLKWYKRSPLDPSTFNTKSRRKIQEVVQESENVFGSKKRIKKFFINSIKFFGGTIQEDDSRIYKVKLPETLQTEFGKIVGPLTFDRDFAMEHGKIRYLSPDSDLLSALVDRILTTSSKFGGIIGMKLLPFLKKPGITYNYRVTFEDGNGELIQEELIPIFVDAQSNDAQRALGERVVDGETLKAQPDTWIVAELFERKDELKAIAEKYICKVVKNIRKELEEERKEEAQREIGNLKEYSEKERNRIQEFIHLYEEKAREGDDMEIAIRGQKARLKQLELRIKKRRKEIRRKTQIISLAPEIENYCLSLPGGLAAS